MNTLFHNEGRYHKETSLHHERANKMFMFIFPSQWITIHFFNHDVAKNINFRFILIISVLVVGIIGTWWDQAKNHKINNSNFLNW